MVVMRRQQPQQQQQQLWYHPDESVAIINNRNACLAITRTRLDAIRKLLDEIRHHQLIDLNFDRCIIGCDPFQQNLIPTGSIPLINDANSRWFNAAAAAAAAATTAAAAATAATTAATTASASGEHAQGARGQQQHHHGRSTGPERSPGSRRRRRTVVQSEVARFPDVHPVLLQASQGRRGFC